MQYCSKFCRARKETNLILHNQVLLQHEEYANYISTKILNQNMLQNYESTIFISAKNVKENRKSESEIIDFFFFDLQISHFFANRNKITEISIWPNSNCF